MAGDIQLIENENPYTALSEGELLEKLEKAREYASKGVVKEASEVSQDMRSKYCLYKQHNS